MKINSKIFKKSLVLGTKQLSAIKGGASWTQCGTNNQGQSNSTRDYQADSSTTKGTICGLPDSQLPSGIVGTSK